MSHPSYPCPEFQAGMSQVFVEKLLKVGVTWESKFSSAQEEKSTWGKPWEAGNPWFPVLCALPQ